MIQPRRFQHQYRKWRWIFEIRADLGHGLAPVLLPEFLDRLHILKEYNLLRRKHGKRLRLFERRLRLIALRRIPRHRPGPRCFGHKSLDQLSSAGVAKVRLFPQQQNCRYGLALLQSHQQFFS